MAASDSSQTSTLRADYNAPKESRTFSHPLPALATRFSIKDKTEYLSRLRASVAEMQKEINVFLTIKMEEDKAKAIPGDTKVDDAKEEENYGEEIVDED